MFGDDLTNKNIIDEQKRLREEHLERLERAIIAAIAAAEREQRQQRELDAAYALANIHRQSL